ncbi:MAG: hypothetical protein AAGE52_08745 [Myxococcota bacterium]
MIRPPRVLLFVLIACSGGGDVGTMALFDLEADLQQTDTFYAIPFPSDLRLDAEGHPMLAGLPRHDNESLIEPLVQLASEAEGWPILPVADFAFDAPIAPAHQDDGVQTAAFFLDIDEASPERGRRFESIAHVLERDAWTSETTLAITTPPGQLLTPETTYAAVVLRSWNDAEGAPLGTPTAFRNLEDESGPVAELYRPLWGALAMAGVNAEDVAIATVFTTGDAIAGVAARSEQVIADHDAELLSLSVDETDGLDHERFCELHGTLRLPQFQTGDPPFDEGGRFEFDADGSLRVQRMEEVPFAIAIPRIPMPDDGYPVVLYAHGTNGVATQVIDRGPRSEPGGPREVGKGPAHVLAAQGFASASIALLLGNDRLVEPRTRAYLNLGNLAAYADTFEQGIFDARLFLDFLEALVIEPALLEGCDGATVPAAGARLDVDPGMMMGQSAGAHMAVMAGAVDPRIRAIAPTGVGGYWSELLATGSEVGGPPELFQLALGTRAELTPLHPGLNLLEAAWERAEPLAFAQRIAERTLEGHAPRHVYVVSSEADGFHPEPLYDAMAVAYGLELTGDELWPEMRAALELAGLNDRPALPVSGNRDVAGATLTLVTQQWAGDGIDDSHGVFGQRTEIKHQYGCFFRSFLDNGIPTVSRPAAEGAPCD